MAHTPRVSVVPGWVCCCLMMMVRELMYDHRHYYTACFVELQIDYLPGKVLPHEPDRHESRCLLDQLLWATLCGELLLYCC